MIATKDHFFMYATADEINDELFYIDKEDLSNNNVQSITFFSAGQVGHFIENSNGIMEKRKDHQSPLMISGEVHNLKTSSKRSGGIVNNKNFKSAFGQIIAREKHSDDLFAKIIPASNNELSDMNDNPNQTIAIMNQCKVSIKRNLETFEVFVPEVTNTVTEEDLNIDWGE